MRSFGLSDKEFLIPVPGRGTVSAIRSDPLHASDSCVYLYAPGAGSNVDDPFGYHLAQHLPKHGVGLVRFQFPYMEAGKRSPDQLSILQETWRAAIAAIRPSAKMLIVGGRSMGGRIGSMVVAADGGIDALALFAYPLHAPGKAERTRDEHFPDLELPVLFCTGTRDSFASPTEIKTAAAKIRKARVHILQDGDHGFSARKSDARTRGEIWDEATAQLIEFALTL